MKKIHSWLKSTSTHKISTTLVYVGCAVFIVVVVVGWFRGLDNAVGMMNCAAMIIVANSVQYAGKAGFEHSKWANPLGAGIASGLTSGDPAAGIQNALSAYQSQRQMEMMANDAGPEMYNDPSIAPPPENMPADDVSQMGNQDSQPSGGNPQ